MPTYEYKALNQNGKLLKGRVEADSKKSAQSQIKDRGLFLQDLKVQDQEVDKKQVFMLKKVGLKDVSLFTRLLSTLLKTNVPLVESLDAIAQQTKDVYFKRVITDIKDQVNEGKPLYLSLKEYPHVFDQIYVSLCESGEAGGNLDLILLRLSSLMEKRAIIKSRVLSALIYPGILLFVTVAIMLILCVYVIPNVTELFEDQGKLPWMTSVTIAFSNFLIQYWLMMIISLSFFSFLFWKWKKTKKGKYTWDRFLLWIPVLGRLMRAADISLFSRTLSVLMTGGIPLLQALDIVKNVVRNELIKEAISVSRENIKEGETIMAPLKKSGQFPAVVLQMIRVGEKTGSLEEMLLQISDDYDRQVDVEVAAFTALLGPVMLIVMACVIGFVLVSVMLPMLSAFDDLG